MTYRVQDGDANTADSDAATLTFTVTVEEAHGARYRAQLWQPDGTEPELHRG